MSPLWCKLKSDEVVGIHTHLDEHVPGFFSSIQSQSAELPMPLHSQCRPVPVLSASTVPAEIRSDVGA